MGFVREGEKYMIRVDYMVVGPVSTNCYFLINEELREAVIVDPGENAKQIQGYLAENELTPTAILLTHGHFDHMMAAAALRDAYGIKVYATAKGFIRKDYAMDADIYCKEGDEFYLAGCTIRVLETPGHTPGGCCYYIPSQNMMFSGDTLFYGSIGRTDFPGGSFKELSKSIKEKLYVLPAETICYSGHGEATRIGFEKEHNPYVR